MALAALSAALPVMLASLVVSVATELVCWVLVYRTSSYKRVRDELDRHAKRLEVFKQSSSSPAAADGSRGGGGSGSSRPGAGNKDRKEKRLEDNVKTSVAQFNASKMKANMLTGVGNLLVMQQVMARFAGQAVARLPFEPPGFLATAFTHRGLPGTDVTECSALFLYILTSAFLRLNISMACGWSPSRAAERLMRTQQQLAPPDKTK